MGQDEQTPKLHIDSDWKAQAQAEKERLAAKEQQSGASRGARGQGELPEASFQTLMSVLASQAIMGLGAMADPKSGRVVVDLEGARFSIDLLGVLEEKTRGNIAKEEADELKQLLNDLRARYVQIAQMVSQQQAAGGASQAGAQTGATEPKPEGGPRLVTE